MTQKKLPRLYRARLRLADGFRNTRLRLGNTLKRRFRKTLPYLVLNLAGEFPEYAPPPPRWQRFLPMLGLPEASSSLSLSDVRKIFDRLAADPRVPGVVLRVDDLNVHWATAQTLRGLIAALRTAGKRVIVHAAADFDPLTYFVATAADEIHLAPPATWQVLGLRSENLYLKDALEFWGIQAEVVAVSPYKAAGDQLSRASMSDEQREMLNWLLDGYYHALVQAIAEGRNMPEDQVKTLIDRAPLPADEAVNAGLVDAALYLDELPAHIAVHDQKDSDTPRDRDPEQPPDLTGVMIPFEQGYRSLLAPIQQRSGQLIALISIEGTIIPGSSRDIPAPIPIPFLGNEQTGSETISQALRQIEDDPRIAAVILHVDSPGGSALASDLIWREVERVRRKKPVVAYMGNTAASGGYYVSATADWIVAQPLTVTGSIGVIFMKLLTNGLFSMFSVHRENLTRGAHAGLFSDSIPLDEARRSVVEKSIQDMYTMFKNRVLAGRKSLTLETLEAVAGGRVWLGQQALAHGLVDELGDLKRAVDKAKELAHLPQDRWTPVVWVNGEHEHALPAPFPTNAPNTWLNRVGKLLNENVWMISPFEMKIK